MRMRTALLGVAVVAGGVVAAVSAPAYAAPPGCGNTYSTPVLIIASPNFVEVDGEIACADPNNPNDGKPLLVTLQERGGGDVVHVAGQQRRFDAQLTGDWQRRSQHRGGMTTAASRRPDVVPDVTADLAQPRGQAVPDGDPAEVLTAPLGAELGHRGEEGLLHA